jgi:hypothetical protein
LHFLHFWRPRALYSQIQPTFRQNGQKCDSLPTQAAVERVHRGVGRRFLPALVRPGVKGYLQWKMGQSTTEWQRLIETRMREDTILRKRLDGLVQRENAIAVEISPMDINQVKKPSAVAGEGQQERPALLTGVGEGRLGKRQSLRPPG